MTATVLHTLPDDTAKMPYLSRRLAKQKVECPRCKKMLQISTLAYSHKCRRAKPIPDHVVQCKVAEMRHAATNNFHHRMATVDAAPDKSCATPLPAPPMDSPRSNHIALQATGVVAKSSEPQ